MSSGKIKNENSGSNSDKDQSNDSRRNILKIGLGLSVLLAMGGVGAVAKTLISPGAQPTSASTQTVTSGSSALPPPASPGFPVILVANVNSVQVDNPIPFNYPLQETPNLLVKLGQKAPGGVGPDGDIVAFSEVCQHLGCIWGFLATGSSPSCNSSYKAAGPVGYCCCHGSQYDLADAAKVIGGPAPRPVPQVILNFDSATGNIYATGMGPPTIFGYDTGSNDVSNDLVGGTLV
jgi:arsenite oxidase small subunit